MIHDVLPGILIKGRRKNLKLKEKLKSKKKKVERQIISVPDLIDDEGIFLV